MRSHINIRRAVRLIFVDGLCVPGSVSRGPGSPEMLPSKSISIDRNRQGNEPTTALLLLSGEIHSKASRSC